MLIGCFIFSNFTINAFSFSSLVAVRMHISILTVAQKGLNSGEERGHVLLKYVLLQINFQVEGQLYVNCYFHMITF